MVISSLGFAQTGPIYNFNFYNPEHSVVKQLDTGDNSKPKEMLDGSENESQKGQEGQIVNEKERKGILSLILDNLKNRTWIGASHSLDKSGLNDGVSRIALYLPFGESGYYVAPFYQGGKITRLHTLHHQINYHQEGSYTKTKGYGVGLYKHHAMNNWLLLRMGGSYSVGRGKAADRWYGELEDYTVKTYEGEVSPCLKYKNLMLAGMLKIVNQQIEIFDVAYKKTSMFYGLELGLRI